jgi:hypothetical protein
MARPVTVAIGSLSMVFWLLSLAIPRPRARLLGIPIGFSSLWPVWTCMAILIGIVEIVAAVSDRGEPRQPEPNTMQREESRPL